MAHHESDAEKKGRLAERRRRYAYKRIFEQLGIKRAEPRDEAEEPRLRIEETAIGRLRITYREICGARTIVHVTKGRIQRRDHLILSINHDAEELEVRGYVGQAAGTRIRVVGGRLLAPLPVGEEAVQAVVSVVEQAVEQAILKL